MNRTRAKKIEIWLCLINTNKKKGLPQRITKQGITSEFEIFKLISLFCIT